MTEVERTKLPPAFWAALSAYIMWGLLPAFLHLFSKIPPLEVTAQRIVWTLPCAFLAALLFGGLASLRITARTLALLALSAALIGGNWLLYVWAVGQDRILESSLGYFINPLINVCMGVAFFKEKLTKWQIGALTLALLGVLNQTFLVGAFPYVALGLGFSFALYGLVRKLAPVQPAAGLFWESAILFLPALVIIIWHMTTLSRMPRTIRPLAIQASRTMGPALPSLPPKRWFVPGSETISTAPNRPCERTSPTSSWPAKR